MNKMCILFLPLYFFAFLISLGCAPKVVINPDIALVLANNFSISGKIDYEGNTEYLPRTISADINSDAMLTLRYRYDIRYEKDTVPKVIIFINPFNLLGFPTGTDTVFVTAKLEVLKGSSQVKTYSAECVLEKVRSVYWEGETLTFLRKKGLLAVRENIEAQMYADSDLLQKVNR